MVVNITQCVTKKEAAKLLGVTLRQVTNYLAAGELSEDSREKGKVMIDIFEVYTLRTKNKNRKRG
jgi:predicted site-specific integrase-resolvase